MVIDNLETLQPRFDASYSGGDFVGIAIDTEVWTLCPGAALGRSSDSNSAVKDERLAERVRIAQELHDTLLQGFCRRLDASARGSGPIVLRVP